ncbi:MAG TPA: hypothetical protein VFL15_03795 [Gammaproteobacteria bacterium]|nr:hypothetical protein [Gammaproteobacteria bacterium]
MTKRLWSLFGVTALLGIVLVLPTTVSADVIFTVSADFGPPPLPYYAQPPCPGAGFIWTPGYWAFDDDDGYFWVPGSWVLAPAVGLLWTPGWWGWDDGYYRWHRGYWGWHVGFYGGINYGYGYPGEGYWGGFWDHDEFHYNREANNVAAAAVQYTYNRPVPVAVQRTRISYNGGSGGIATHETPEQRAFAQEQHFALTDAQQIQQRMARDDSAQRWSVNHGAPPIAATVRAGEFGGSGVAGMNPKEFAHRSEPVAHTQPGAPGFKRAQRLESMPVPQLQTPRSISNSHSWNTPVPVRHDIYRVPVMQVPHEMPSSSPQVRGGASITVNSRHAAARVQIESHHTEKSGRPPR